ncbi:MAG TPA: hypothetical protein VNR63_03160 [Gaiellaceae bacterium]|jgi:hypothetical protein|nr:hypothetical protein [Gaiellaceae bacterium]
MTRKLIPAAIAAAALLVPAAAAGPQAAPQAVGQPVVTGKTVQGETLTTTNGRWTGSTPITYQYRWLRCDASGGGVNGVNCVTIPGETRRTLVLSAADVGHRIRSRVIASNAEGTNSANSNATASVVQPSSTAGRPVNQKPPTISGTPQQNSTLTANPGTWSGAKPQTYAFQWRRCDSTGGSCADISAATAQTYVLKDVDVGKTLRVRVTAKNSLGSRSATSAPSAVVQKAGAPSGSTVLVSDVALPNRLVIDRVQFSPFILRSRRPVVARFHVSDLQNHPVQGALVFVVGIPFGNTTTPREQATGSDGWVTFVVKPTHRLRIARAGNQPFFVRARKPGDRLIAGVSVRRLVNLSIRAG